MKTTKMRIAAGILALATVAGLTACSSDSGSGGGEAGSGETVKIMVFGSFSQPPFPLKQIKTAAEAAVEAVNADGGIDGTTIELISCDDQSSANGSTACGRQAVEEDVAAVVGAFTLFGDNIVPQLEAADIPYILPEAISPQETTSPISFPIASASTPSAADMLAFKEQGCDTVVITAPAGPQSEGNYQAGFVPLGENLDQPIDVVYYPVGTTDFASVAAQIEEKGDCLVYGGGAQETVAIVTALNQAGADVSQAVLSTIGLPESTLGELGAVGDGIKVFSPFYYPSVDEKAVQTAVKNMTAADSAIVVDETALNAYAAVLTFAQAAGMVDGEITGAAIIKALSTPGNVFDTGMYAPTDFTETAGFFPPTPRVAGNLFQGYVAKDGIYEPEGDQLDLTGKLGF